MSYKEKREYEQLTQEIDALTEEQKKLEEELCSGNLSVEELTEKASACLKSRMNLMRRK